MTTDDGSVLINISPSMISHLCLCLNDFIKIVRLLLADVSINGSKSHNDNLSDMGASEGDLS